MRMVKTFTSPLVDLLDNDTASRTQLYFMLLTFKHLVVALGTYVLGRCIASIFLTRPIEKELTLSKPYSSSYLTPYMYWIFGMNIGMRSKDLHTFFSTPLGQIT